MNELFDNPVALANVEAKREVRRQRNKGGRMTFDCHHAIVKGDRVECEKGQLLGTAKDGTMFIWDVLRGTTASVCRTCIGFDGAD